MAKAVLHIKEKNPDACIAVLAGGAHLHGLSSYIGFMNSGAHPGLVSKVEKELGTNSTFSMMPAWSEPVDREKFAFTPVDQLLANGRYDVEYIYEPLARTFAVKYPTDENTVIIGLTEEDTKRTDDKTSGRGTIDRHPLNNERPSGSLLAGRPGGSTKFDFTREGLAIPSRADVNYRTSQTRAGARSRVDIASRGNDRHGEAPRSGSSRGQVSKNFNDKPIQLNTGEPFSLQTLGVDVTAITLFDLQGQQVFHSDNQQIIGLSVRPAMYIARVSYQDGATLQRKVVVR